MFAPAKRHDIALIERVHTATDLKWKKTEWKTYELIKATKVAKGKILHYVTGDGANGIIHSSHRVFVITDTDKQAAAKDLFGCAPFESAEAAKAAILDRAEALR
jgi:hypothetical protein